MEKENRMAYEKAMEALNKQLGKAPVYKELTNYGYKVNWEEL